jgi:hypothetical protein
MSMLSPAPRPDLDFDTVLHLTVAVRQNRPLRWAWHLVDGRDGSWFESQYEFDSPGAARRSGLARLAELTPSLPTTAAGVRTAAAATGQEHLVIVSGDDTVYGLVQQVFAENTGIGVLRDRRRPGAPERRNGERRLVEDGGQTGPAADWRGAERRTGERRSIHVEAVQVARGWWIVCRSGACHTTQALDESA